MMVLKTVPAGDDSVMKTEFLWMELVSPGKRLRGLVCLLHCMRRIQKKDFPQNVTQLVPGSDPIKDWAEETVFVLHKPPSVCYVPIFTF